MSTDATDRPDAAASVPGHLEHVDAVDVLDGPQEAGHRHAHPALGVWRFLISMRTGLWIILILGVLTLIGTLVIQATPEILADPASYQAWYEAGPRQKYGGWAPVLGTLGLFGVFSTWYFRALFALLAVSILACSINRAPRLWKVATAPRIAMSDAFFSHAGLRAELAVPGGVEDAAARVRAALRADRFRVLSAPADGGLDFYGDRFRWGPFGTVLAHLSFVIILAGFVVSATQGFKEAEFIAPVGVGVEVGHGTGLTVTALSFHDAYYDNGAPKDYVSDLVLTRDGVQVARQDTRVNDPLRFEGVWFHQAFFGIGVDVRATKDGAAVFGQTVPLEYQSSDGQKTYNRIEVPAAGHTVYVIQAASGKSVRDLPPGSLGLEVHPAGGAQPTFQVLGQGQSAVIDGVTYTFDRNRQYTGLIVSRDPGAVVVWLGSALLMAGSVLVFFFPHRRVWVRVRQTEDAAASVLMAAPLKRDPAFEPLFADLVHRLTAAEQ